MTKEVADPHAPGRADAITLTQRTLARALSLLPEHSRTMAELSRRSGLSDRALRALKAGRNPANLSTVADLARACGLTLTQLLYGALIERQETPTDDDRYP